MSVQSRANPASHLGKQVARSHRAWPGVVVLACLLVLGVAACVPTPPAPVVGADPADPAALVSPVRYQSTTTGYVRQRPVEPATWREQNQRVAPQAKP
jgi:hypothetical protein